MLLADLQEEGGPKEERAAQAWVRLRPSVRITARAICTTFRLLFMLILKVADIIFPFDIVPVPLR